MAQYPITKPYLTTEERELILKPLESGWLVQGPYVAEFEKLFANYVGSKYAVATTSCTTALHLGLLALGIGKGDKVIVPSFTYVASANSVEYTGAEVIFCDIDLKTFNLNPHELEILLEKKKHDKDNIKAIMPVHLFGLCADMPYIQQLAQEYNLKIIEDAACAHGSLIGNKHAGTFGSVGCFSFHPRKVITTGEGGIIVTDDPQIAELVKSLRDHGASKSDFARHLEAGGSLLPEFNILGYNYRMTDIQGALGVAQMKKIDYIITERRKLAELYTLKLQEIPFLIPPHVPLGYFHNYQSYVCLYVGDYPKEEFYHITHRKEEIDRLNIERNLLMRNLEKDGIFTRQGTHAVHTLGYYKRKYNLKDDTYFKSYIADRLSIALPLYVGIEERDIDYILERLLYHFKIFKQGK